MGIPELELDAGWLANVEAAGLGVDDGANSRPQ